jgi:ubiquinone/menaquinone biosynthesis C-methylase UbiE
MNEFDLKAAGWDSNPMHTERSETIARLIREEIPLNKEMTGLEFGAGTGITSFLLSVYLKEITMMDNSREMVRMMNEKILKLSATNLRPVFFDLEHSDYREGSFDLIFTQMVTHHIADIESIFNKFSALLNTGGYLAIADLYSEDGSFHGDGFTGHKGFDPETLALMLREKGFTGISHKKCYTIEKGSGKFDVFLLTGQLTNKRT